MQQNKNTQAKDGAANISIKQSRKVHTESDADRLKLHEFTKQINQQLLIENRKTNFDIKTSGIQLKSLLAKIHENELAKEDRAATVVRRLSENAKRSSLSEFSTPSIKYSTHSDGKKNPNKHSIDFILNKPNTDQSTEKEKSQLEKRKLSVSKNGEGSKRRKPDP